MSVKGALVSFLVTAVTVAVIFRVNMLRTTITGLA